MRRAIIAISASLLLLFSTLLLVLDPPAQASARAAVPPHLRAYYWAVSQEGKPYTWGGTGPWGYDCSGLVVSAYLHEGIRLPRTTYNMLGTGLLIPERAPRTGDLAFFGSGHVELALAGSHTTFGAQQPGTVVWWHHWSYAWGYYPDMYFRVRGAG
jgi:cell wall-associated NlpC family hydrolase